MKRISFRLKPLFIILSLLFFAQAPAHAILTESSSDLAQDWGEMQEWSWTARIRAQANLLFDQKPSSLRGQTSTDWGSLEFANELVSDQSPFSVGIAGTVGPERDPDHDQPYFQWEELRFTWTHKPELSFGLLYDPVIRFDAEEWQESSLGRDFESGLRRWSLIPESDLGLQLNLGTSFGLWTLQVTNGEGWPNRENGTKKDAELVWTQPFLLHEALLRAQLFYRYGAYDNLGDDQTAKQRAGIQLAVTSGPWGVGASGVSFSDPVDGVNGVLGEGVDLSARGGQTNRGNLQEAWVRYHWGEESKPWRALVRSALLKTDESNSDKDISSLVMGLGKNLGSGMQINLLFQGTDFGSAHSLNAEDRQRWFVAWVWGVERHPSLE